MGVKLTPYVDSIGKGFGPGYRMSGFIAVSGAGRPLYARGFGYADHETERENTLDTSFRVGAITKQFTATATLALVAEGKLELGDPIRKHLPEYPRVGADISVHHLLSHTAGLPSYLNDPTLRERRAQPFTPRELLELFWQEPLEFSPGDDFLYSYSGYAVLGAIIERRSGRTYAEHMARELFSPLGLERTVVGDPASARDLALGYAAGSAGELARARNFDSSVLYAGGAVRSTAGDLLAWHDILQTGEVLPDELASMLQREVRDGYGYGWFVKRSHGLDVLRHAGGLDGFASHFGRIPELDLAIVVLANNSSVDAGSIFDAALSAALGQKVKPLRVGASAPLDPAVLSRITGLYRLSEAEAKLLERRKIPKKTLRAMRSVRIYEEGSKLYFKPVGQSAVPMITTSPGQFVLLGGKAKIEVPLDPDDAPATLLILEQGPLRVEFTRRARVRGKPLAPEAEDSAEAE